MLLKYYTVASDLLGHGGGNTRANDKIQTTPPFIKIRHSPEKGQVLSSDVNTFYDLHLVLGELFVFHGCGGLSESLSCVRFACLEMPMHVSLLSESIVASINMPDSWSFRRPNSSK